VILQPEFFHALIVAIDKYDDDRITELKSPVTDTLEVLRWLGALGVPPENITCHVASRSPHRPPGSIDAILDPEGRAPGVQFTAAPERTVGAVRLMNAKRDSIVRSIGELLHLPVEPADSGRDGSVDGGLVVFLLGHGFQLPQRNEPTTRVFLTEDYTLEIPDKNIPMGYLTDTLLYTAAFRHVTVVFDACSVQPYTAQQRETVSPEKLGILLGDPNVATGVALCSASGQLERAQESVVSGEGSVFLAAFLEATDRIEDDCIEFEGIQPVVDLRRVMARYVTPRVRARTAKGQNPALVTLGAYTEQSQEPCGSDDPTWPVPLYRLDRAIDRVAFCRERRARETAGGERSWVDIALDHRWRVVRARGLRLGSDRFREATSHAAGVPTDGTGGQSLIEGLLIIESDLRSQAETLGTERWQVPPDMSDELRAGKLALEEAAEYADRARQPGDDRLSRLALAAQTYVEGLQELRLVIEVAYTKAVWEALRNVVRRTEWLAADDAVRVIGQWVAVADAPLLSSKADEIALRTGTDVGSPGLLLLRQHLRLEHERSWIREGDDQRSTPTTVELLEQVRAQVEEALVGDAAPPLLDAIRRLLETYPAVSDDRDRLVLEALNRRAAPWTLGRTG
jgi:hypothetical protein